MSNVDSITRTVANNLDIALCEYDISKLENEINAFQVELDKFKNKPEPPGQPELTVLQRQIALLSGIAKLRKDLVEKQAELVALQKKKETLHGFESTAEWKLSDSSTCEFGSNITKRVNQDDSGLESPTRLAASRMSGGSTRSPDHSLLRARSRDRSWFERVKETFSCRTSRE